MIEFKNLCKSYPLKKRIFHALQDITLTIHRGEIFGILGESGAGKSTLLRSVNRLDRPSRGAVYVNGLDMATLSAQQLKAERRRMGMIFQQANLLESRTAFQNIALPFELLGKSKSDVRRSVFSLLELVHLTHHSDHYPHQLSGGQKQRVAIARALATHPYLLLCDEATSSLDPTSTASILDLLKDIHRHMGMTILLITHEMDVIKKICDRAAVLDQGRLLEYGSVLDLFAHPKSTIMKQFIEKTLHIELPIALKKSLRPEASANASWIVRFTFVGHESQQPLITTLIRKFDITINIIQAHIENIQDTLVGFMISQWSGDPVLIEKALASIPVSITAEILGYV